MVLRLSGTCPSERLVLFNNRESIRYHVSHGLDVDYGRVGCEKDNGRSWGYLGMGSRSRNELN